MWWQMHFKKSPSFFLYIYFFPEVLYPLSHADATVNWTELYWSDLTWKPNQKNKPQIWIWFIAQPYKESSGTTWKWMNNGAGMVTY